MEFKRECAHKTMTFEDIRACIDADRTDVLGRSEVEQNRYIDAMASIREKYATISDYVLSSKFGFEVARKGDGKLEACPPHENYKQTILSVNDFPYNFTADVKSYILWKHGKGDVTITQDEIEIAMEDIKMQLGTENYLESLCFESAPHLKSVPDLAHVHLLVQMRI